MWAQLQDLNSPQKRGRTATTPPLSKGMWAVYCHSMVDWGREKHQGGPRKWEAHSTVHLENELQRLSWSFSPSLIPSHPTDHPCAQRQCIKQRHDW